MLIALVIVGFFAAYSLSRVFMRHQIDLALPLSPALFLGLWTFAIAAVVNRGVPLSAVWQPFWIAITVATVAGVLLSVRDRTALDLRGLFIPIATASVIMAPYLIHGISSFPGSYLWDGFAYMAGGESLWLHPRRESAAGLELFYQFGHFVAQARYTSSSVIVLLKGIYPPGGDAQAAMGYFLFLSLLTFSSSCYFLARVTMQGRRYLQLAFVVTASVSGPLLNLVWVNNFDHLLAMSIAPVIVALAFMLRWGAIGDAILLGLFIAAEAYVYTEMAALFAMPAGLILLVRLFRERSSREQLVSCFVAAATAVLLVAPAWSDLYAFFLRQLNMVAGAARRPGSGYFRTFATVVCGPPTWFGMFRPFADCEHTLADYVKLVVSIGCWAVLAAALLSWRRNVALIIAAGITVASAVFFGILRYDYGAFKMLETGWVPLLLLATLASIEFGRTTKLAISCVAAALVIISVGQVAAFERWVTLKSIEPFSELERAVPLDGGVEVRIADPVAFQWATYYLRRHQATFPEGSLTYFPPSVAEPVNQKEPLKYLVTDRPTGRNAIWTNGTLYLYSGGT